jgi:hypothetical protein
MLNGDEGIININQFERLIDDYDLRHKMNKNTEMLRRFIEFKMIIMPWVFLISHVIKISLKWS